MQFLTNKLDSLFTPIFIPLLETILFIEGDGPISIPFNDNNFLIVLYYLFNSRM
jgi:hypothetical protein